MMDKENVKGKNKRKGEKNMNKEKISNLFDDIINLSVKTGIFYPSCEIYGSLAGFYDYGHLGAIVKREWEGRWREYFLNLHHNFWEIDGNTIMPRTVFIGSGHLKNFVDPLVECKKCRSRHRADHLIESELGIKHAEDLTIDQMNELIKEHNIKCPECGGDLSVIQWFNMMFDLTVGPSLGELKGLIRDAEKSGNIDINKLREVYDRVEKNTAYLRPETAQTPYMCFKREFETLRSKLPLGLAVIGRAYRNEISPRQALFRMREFTQAELQIFFDPNDIDLIEGDGCVGDCFDEVKDNELNVHRAGQDQEVIRVKLNSLGLPKKYAYYMAKVYEFLTKKIGLPEDKLRMRELTENEKAFYNILHWDVEFYFESFSAYREIAGVHYRGDHDLKGHSEASGQSLQAVRQEGSKFYPHVIELSFGVDRNLFALIDSAYNVEEAPTAKGGTENRIVLKLPQHMAPIQVAVFPLLSNREGLVTKAKEVYNILTRSYRCFYDASGAIGRRYRRQDWIGTPYCITIDFDTLEDDTVTVRDRDSMKQERINIGQLLKYFNEKFLDYLD